MECTKCGKENPAGSRFCQYCGAQIGEGAGAAAQAPPARSPAPASQPRQQQQAARTPAAGARAATAYSSASPARRQMGAGGTVTMDIWGPFAGYGQRGHHASWLLDNKAEMADTLHSAISERFQQRQVPQAEMGWQNLTGKGLVVERRPFYFIKRGITTVALYIGEFGKDLYVSQVTYAKGPISNVRVVILGLMVLFQLFFMFGFLPALASSAQEFDPFFGTGPSIESLLFLSCVVGPLGINNTLMLGLILLYSIYKWFKEKDFLSVLRVPPNEFQLDDIVALEKSVEETVRQSLDAVGLDISDALFTTTDYGFKRRLI